DPVLGEDLQVLRGLRLPQVQPLGDLSDRQRPLPEQIHDAHAVGLGQRLQGPEQAGASRCVRASSSPPIWIRALPFPYILVTEYSCQGMFGWGSATGRTSVKTAPPSG